MNNESDQGLLREYAECQSQMAFAELVRRHIDLVFSAARRLVVDSHLSEDVTQGVFVALARDARTVASKLESGVPLSGWLHTTTRHLAVSTIRTEQRRRDREQKAATMEEPPAAEVDVVWDHVAPHLDHVLAELTEADRHAILLRFFERKSAREIGERLGWTEEAAQKRVHRALERLREVFVARGLAVPSATLAGALTANAVQMAPMGLGTSILSGVGALVLPSAAISSAGLLSLMATAKIKLTVAALSVAAVTGTLLLQQRENHRLQAEVTRLRTPQPAIPMSTGTDAVAAVEPGPSGELLRLRGEVAALRRLAAEMEGLRRENARLKARTANAGPAGDNEREAMEEHKRMGLARLNYAKAWGTAFFKYASEHNDQYPSSLEDAAKFFETDEDVAGLTPDQFELIYRGSMATLGDPARTIVLREKQAFASGNPDRPGWMRTYLFADGHSEIHFSANGDYQDFERDRLPSTSDAAQAPTLTLGGKQN